MTGFIVCKPVSWRTTLGATRSQMAKCFLGWQNFNISDDSELFFATKKKNSAAKDQTKDSPDSNDFLQIKLDRAKMKEDGHSLKITNNLL